MDETDLHPRTVSIVCRMHIEMYMATVYVIKIMEQMIDPCSLGIRASVILSAEMGAMAQPQETVLSA